MWALKRQYLLAFGVMGSVVPYVPVILDQRLGDRALVGDVLSLTGVAIIVTPVIMTFLADAYVASRTLMAILFGVIVAAAWLLSDVHTPLAIAAAYGLLALALWPQLSLQDGLTFGVNRARTAAGQPGLPFHRVRVYGTIGFILPTAALYLLMARGASASIALLVGCGVATLGLINTTRLPRPEPASPARKTRLPTWAAARQMFRGQGLLLCVAIFIAQTASAAYYAFYPIYLTAEIGFADKWIGPIAIVGVVLEIGVMLAVGPLLRRIGLTGTLVLGLGCAAARLALLALWPHPVVAVAVQGFHGMSVIALNVLPLIYLDSLAKDAYRSSMQGLYAMVVIGVARIAGSHLGGRLAEVSLLDVFGAGAIATAGATLMLLLWFRPGFSAGAAHRAS